MKTPAILCLLWPRFARVVEPFLAKNPGTAILAPRFQASQELVNAVARANGQLVLIDDLLTEADVSLCRERARAIATTIGDHQQTLGWNDFSARWEIAPEALAAEVTQVAEQTVPAQISLLQMLDKASETYQIGLTILSEDLLALGKTTAYWSRLRKIPSIHLLHGVALARPYTVHERLICDTLAVYGERSVESYLDAGIGGDRIRITGNPAWDDYPERLPRRAEEKAQLQASYGLDPAAPIVVFSPTWAHNLSAISDEHIFGRSLTAFIETIRELREQGLEINAVIKDRPHNYEFGKQRFSEICAELGVDRDSFHYLQDAPEPWVVAADVLIGIDSNILVEALLCGTPAINLMTDWGLRLGPSFDGDSGIVEVPADELGKTLLKLIADPLWRKDKIDRMRAAAPRYNIGVDGKASLRVAELMSEQYRQQAAIHQGYVWQDCLDVPDIDATGYHGGARGDLVDYFTNAPKMLLDIGCAAGGTGAAFKQKYPEGTVWGFELNRSAAAIASQRLDRVFTGKFEETDLAAAGLQPGSVDAVILADVLEHMYNPWKVMEVLRPWLSPTAQIAVSIPNVRNLALMDDLAKGYFRYERLGLLDITHIRFFTYKELQRFFHETGYHVVKNVFGIDTRLNEIFQRYKDHCPCDIDTGKMVIRNVSQEELMEMCSLQFFMLVEPGREQLVGYEQVGQFQQAPEQVYANFLSSHLITRPEAEMFERRLAEWESERGSAPRVLITIYLLPEYFEALTASIQALAGQYYDHVEVVIASPAEVPDELRAGTRIRWHQSSAAPHAALNQVIADSDADWVLSLNAGDQIAPHALLLLLEAAHTHPDWKLIYADDDRRDSKTGVFDQPFFKPDFDTDYLHSLPWIGDCYLISRQTLEELGGYAPEFAGMAEYQLQLRLLEQYGPAVFGHVPDILFHLVRERSTAKQPTEQLLQLGQQALARHLENHGLPAESVKTGSLPGTYRVDYPLPAEAMVSIVLLSHNRPDTLRRSLAALLAQTAQLPDGLQCEIIVIDAASDDPETLAYLQEIDGSDNDRLRVFPADSIEQGYTRLLNIGAAQTCGDYLLFLAADCVPLSPNWLTAMLAHANRPGIGCVGGRLIDKQGQIVSAGRILGLLGDAASPWQGIKFDQPGYFGRLHCTQQRQALSLECLLLKRATFVEAGGFDEGFRYLFADADLCLRLRAQGLAHVWTPEATLMHEALDLLILSDIHDDEKQGVYEVDRNRLYDFWLDALANDPSYNRNLSLFNTEGVIEPRSELTKLKLTWRPLPRMLAIPMDNAGCGNYRVVEPFNAALKANQVDGWCRFGTFQPLDVARMAPDILYLQRHVLDVHQAALANYRRHFPQTRIVFELDDLMWAVPEKSVHRKDLPADLRERITHSLSLCDRLIVTTEPLAEMLRDLAPEVRVVPNSIDTAIWGTLTPRRRKDPKPRVGWAGGSSHTGDLEILLPVIEALKDEVDWVFFGMFPAGTRELIQEYHGGVSFAEYAPKLATLDLDLALAPLEENLFNECKSNLRLLEYGVLGYPVIATDLTPYRCGLPVTLVDNAPTSWIEAIRKAVADRDALASTGDALRTAVLRDWTLDKFQESWRSAWLDETAPREARG
ncbi:MAG: glycosyltransferase [Azonexus sp.]|nr:glycosyltransferase [Azonexus sp.]MCK6413180.1 glycosyltransferase [Azonexus sp.]